MANSFMVAESTNLTGARIFSLQSTKDLQNGAIVSKGDLVTGETSVYTAGDYTTGDKYLVLNPAWSYDNNRLTDQNEENFVNKAGVAFRAYKLAKDMKYKIYNTGVEFNVGDEIEYDSTTDKYKKGTTTGLKVVAKEEVGFPYCIGSIGAKIVGDSTNKYGYATGANTIKYTVEVTA
jgi:hypothetical protein